MKKAITLTLIILFLFLFTGCAARYRNVSLVKIGNIEEIFLKNLNSDFGYCDVSEYYKSNYFSEVEQLKECKIFTSNESTNFDEFGIFEFENERHAKKAKNTLKNYLRSTKTEFENGIIYDVTEYPKFESARVETFGNYLVYAILEDEIIEKIFAEIDKTT